jgi:anthranilate phosphoribosyltransferase
VTLVLAGVVRDLAEGAEMAREALIDGTAIATLEALVATE